MSPGWVDIQSEKAPRPSSAVVQDMGTGQPSIPTSMIGAGQLKKPLLPYTIGTEFVATDDDDITWGADGTTGDSTITFADLSTQTIVAGSLNLANANPYYIYCTIGDTSLNNTQTFGNAIGGDNILIAFAIKGANTSQKALIVAGTKGPKLFIDKLSAISADMGLLTAGEIRVGTGTLGSNFTGWRFWVDTSVGRIGGYASDVLQWYSDTNGVLVAGAGAVKLDAYGVRVIGYTGFRMENPENTDIGALFASATGVELFSVVGYNMLVRAQDDAGTRGGMNLVAGAGIPAYAAKRIQLRSGERITLTADDDVVITPGAAKVSIVDRMDSSSASIGSAIDTTYQNTSGKLLLVFVSIILNATGEAASAKIAATSGGVAVIGLTALGTVTTSNFYHTMTFLVPVAWYYRINTEAGSPAIHSWTERTIG